MIRVVQPGGTIAILEFSRPRGRILGPLYLAFFRHLLPRVGQALAPNQDGAYDYLPRSVLEFPDGQAMLDLLESRGLTDRRERARLSVPKEKGRRPVTSMRRSLEPGACDSYECSNLHPIVRIGSTLSQRSVGVRRDIVDSPHGPNVGIQRTGLRPIRLVGRHVDALDGLLGR